MSRLDVARVAAGQEALIPTRGRQQQVVELRVARVPPVHPQQSVDLAQEVLKNLIKIKEKDFNVSTIQKTVANHFNIKPSDIKSSRKHKGVVLPRQICMYLTRKLTTLSFPEIGAHFGGKDHSTIIYAVKKIEKELKSNQHVKNSVNTLIKKLDK